MPAIVTDLYIVSHIPLVGALDYYLVGLPTIVDVIHMLSIVQEGVVSGPINKLGN